MQIQSVANYGYYRNNTIQRNQDRKKEQSFGSLFADANAKNVFDYGIYTEINPDFKIMKCSSTRIFRELSSELAISKLLNPDEKSEIRVLGCSDGSEAWAYAIAVKETMKDKAKNVKIKGIDIAPYLSDLAKTEHLVLSTVEKEYADSKNMLSKDKSPLRGKGWYKYLSKAQRPEQFNEILEKYPFTKFMEYDPIAIKSIGKGLDWYKINKDGLPDVKFECADMRTSLSPNDDCDNQVYVIANSSAYLIQKDPNDFIKLFENIKTENKDIKNVYVVIGNLEKRFLDSTLMGIMMQCQINSMGFENVSSTELKKLGIKGNDEASSKIFKLKKQ